MRMIFMKAPFVSEVSVSAWDWN